MVAIYFVLAPPISSYFNRFIDPYFSAILTISAGGCNYNKARGVPNTGDFRPGLLQSETEDFLIECLVGKHAASSA